MFVIAIGSLLAALGLQYQYGGSQFLPSSDYGMLAIDVRTPASSSLDYSRAKVEGVAALARTIPEAKATNSFVNPGGGRVYLDQYLCLPYSCLCYLGSVVIAAIDKAIKTITSTTFSLIFEKRI